MTEEAPTIWLDTTTLYQTFRRPGDRASGIPRVAMECIEAARAYAQTPVRLCRVQGGPRIQPVSWSEYEALLRRSQLKPPRLPSLREAARRLPPEIVVRLQDASSKAKSASHAIRSFRLPRGEPDVVSHPFRPGDWWVNLGCWWHGEAPSHSRDLKATGFEIRTAVLIHDCMPILLPEYFPREQLVLWTDGRAALEESTDVVLVGSTNTRRDVSEVFPALEDRVRRIRLGDSFSRPVVPAALDEVLGRYGIEQPYVLIVGTIEARKNHALAFRAWRTLLGRGSKPPMLVFAGRWGWKVADLKGQIRDSGSLNGRLRVVDGPSDEVLDALYRGSLFTLFPSLYEGWGLPVRESLSYGKACVAAQNSSIIEAGDGLAVGFENDSQPGLIDAVVPMFNDAVREEREAEIRTRFRPVSWEETWRDIEDALSLGHS